MKTASLRTKMIFLMALLYPMTGCVTTQKRASSVDVKQEYTAPIKTGEEKNAIPIRIEENLESQSIDDGALQEEAEADLIPTGYVFGKTKFEGVVKTSYVQLSIKEIDASDKIYKLIIGDKARQQSFPWETQRVKPGYFFIELPPGEYRINSITIPVGTSTATEPMDVVFRVLQDKYTYLGTMDVIGTKERIKLGGVPVIQPGFEYSLDRLDEREEAFQEFSLRFPETEQDFDVELMKINKFSNLDAADDIP